MTGVKAATVWLGGAALLSAAFIDTISVIGRQTGMPFHGAIELIQAAVLVSGSIALVFATVGMTHARVGLVLDRMPERIRHIGEVLCALAVALAFAALLAGSAWIAFDLRNAHEASELLRVPWWLLRLFANVCLLMAVLAALWPRKASRS
jgi:TRAP-type C4-dicarboxylate transport system permease small subunit